MRIVNIITGLSDGGAEAVLYRLCTYDKQNHHIVISLMDEGKYGSLLRQAGIKVHCLGMPRGRITFKGIAHLFYLLRTEQSEVVQTWMYHANLLGGVAARLAGVQHVCWGIHNSSLVSGKSKLSTIWIARVCAILSYFGPKRIISCSHKSVKVHEKLGYISKKFIVISNGYSLEHFKPNSEMRIVLRGEWGVADDMPLIGMVARFNSQKDQANLVSALGQLKRQGWRFCCALIGTGMDLQNFQLNEWLKAEGLTDQILLLGQRSDIPAVMNALDIHVLSSAYGEAFPNVLAEAMACGTPCVTTDVGDAAEIVGDTGWVVPPSESGKLAQVLAEALDEWRVPKVWDRRQDQARQRIVKHFSLQKMVEAYRSVWRETKKDRF